MGYDGPLPGLARRRHRRRLQGLRRRGQRGRGRPRRHPPAPGHPGPRPRRPLELQGRQVRLVQRRGQRPAAADVHDPDVHVHRGRDGHGDAAAGVPGDPRPGHRRVVQLREGARRSRRSRRRPTSRPASTACSRSTSSAARSSASASSASCARTPATSSATTRRTSRRSPGRGSSCGSPSSTCTRSTPPTAKPAQDEHGLGFCNITKCCTEVCPEHIKITDNALIPMKERVADRKYDPLFSVSSLFRRNRKA